MTVNPVSNGIYIYIGPTLSPADALKTLEAVYLPPVAQGDLYALVQARAPRVVGIVDGYFNQVPAVWHKEVLWALTHGVHVFGAASMGALRAVELEAYGMRGVGRLFEAYRAGRIEPGDLFEDDDEVAVVHGPAETGYVAVSEALVNMRATLLVAEQQGVISSQVRRALIAAAKTAFYADRSWPWLIDEAARALLDEGARVALGDWIEQHAIDSKRMDALELLTTISQFADRSPAPFKPAFRFEHTSQWRIAVSEWDAVEGVAAEAEEGVLDELRLEPMRYAELWRDAVARALAFEPELDAPRTQNGSENSTPPRIAAGLGNIRDTDVRLMRAHADPVEQRKIWGAERQAATLELAAASLPPVVLERHMLELLRQQGSLNSLDERATAKRNRLVHATGDFAALAEIEKLQLVDWYFTQRLDSDMPDDLEAYAQALDLASLDALHRLLYDEFRFLEAEAPVRP